MSYQTGDRVTYRGSLYELQASGWVYISSCQGSGSANNNANKLDTEAPTTPTGLSYTYDANSNTSWISWNASIDNVGVLVYEVLENGNHFYTLDRTKLGFGGKPKRTSTFTVSAIDAAGNKSAVSEPLVVSADEDPNPCNGVEPWRFGVSYQIGDRVTYRSNLYELQTSRWAFISSCSGSKSLANDSKMVDNTFVAYPNPVSKKLKININPFISPSTYSIIDMQGRLITTKDYSSSIDVENIPKGAYIITLIAKDNSKIEESIFVKE